MNNSYNNSYNQYVNQIRKSEEYMDKQFQWDMSVITANKDHATLLQDILIPSVKGIKLDLTVGHVKNQLLEDNWFGDELINDWGKLLNIRYNEKNTSQTVIFNTQLYGKLTDCETYDFKKVANWKKKTYCSIDENTLEYLIVPINKAIHWFLMVVAIKKKEIWLIDSVENSNPKNYFITIMNFWVDMSLHRNFELVNVMQWKFVVKKCTQQDDGTSCGTHVCSNMLMVANGHHLFNYPSNWVKCFKKFMLQCFRIPYLYSLTDLCQVCKHWCYPNGKETIKCVACKHLFHNDCAQKHNRTKFTDTNNYVCHKNFRRASWCTVIESGE
jgi:Ulp1 family protease